LGCRHEKGSAKFSSLSTPDGFYPGILDRG
jgi:hypothetical protein